MTRRSVRRLALASALVAGSWAAMRQPGFQPVERRASTAIRDLRRPQVDPVVAVATDLGSVYGLAGTGLALAASGRRDVAVELAVGGSIAWGLAQSLKPFANRPRPYDDGSASRLVSIPAGSSWPSGHSAAATAMALALATARGAGTAPRLLGAALAGFVGTSRIYVGVHHPTDVVAGVGVGVASHELARRLVRWRR